MNKAEVLRKYNNAEPLTVSEIKLCQRLVKRIEHTYGKFGNLAKAYIEEHKTGLYWCLLASGEYPKYLYNIDKQADELYLQVREKLLGLPQYKKSEDFMENLRIETEIKQRIEEEILNELIYI